MATAASSGLSTLPKTNGSQHTRLRSNEDGDKGLWSSMLDSVATGKKLDEKNLLVLGGTADSQAEFLESLSPEPPQQRRRPGDRAQSNKKPPIANRFALGYTYQDILDADQDDILARLSIYMLAEPHPSFTKLLQGIFTPTTISNTLIVILLNWDSPWHWIRQVQDWVRILRTILNDLDNDCKDAMDENMKEWSERRKGVNDEGVSNSSDANVSLPPGPGEWDEALGVPVCVVCQNAEKIDNLEREHGWKDDEFDYILQYMRTVLLKHGSSLIYTASSAPGALPNLIRSSLGIHSLLQRNPLKHNVIDRDKILVPPNWDSWGKIRVIREGFEVEGTSNQWSVDIQEPPRVPKNILSDIVDEPRTADAKTNGALSPLSGPPRRLSQQTDDTDYQHPSPSVLSYEKTIQDPNRHRSSALRLGAGSIGPAKLEDGIDTPCQDTQEFLGGQLQVLDRLKVEDEHAQRQKEAQNKGRPGSAAAGAGDRPPGVLSRGDSQQSLSTSAAGGAGGRDRVNEHIGPVQFNMGGIQVDAGDALKSIRERSSAAAAAGAGTSGPTSDDAGLASPSFGGGFAAGSSGAASPGGAGAAEGDGGPNAENEKLRNFFAGLMSRGGTASPGSTQSPK
ncbi:MAG: hypothetical protein M1831_001339 [Alyxoria varia]|nr:MAG: hypothetical protein M1831_001339 [Alyxoria varia]